MVGMRSPCILNIIMHTFYNSDIGLLKSVLVHSPGNEIAKIVPLIQEENASLSLDYLGANATKEHRAFLKLLHTQGVQVLELKNLLSAAIADAKKSEYWEGWLETMPKTHMEGKVRSQDITAEDLLGASDRSYYNLDSTNRLVPIFSPQRMLLFCRDLSVMTPKGLVLCNFVNKYRFSESHLARLIFERSEPFRSLPIVLDAIKEGVYIQGGDLIVKDKNTLLLGVNNLTEKNAARLLAQRLDMLVVAVNLPPAISISKDIYGNFTNANLSLLHLDSVFSLVDTDKFLVVPYWFEKASKSALLGNVVLGLDPYSSLQPRLLQRMEDVGWVTLYHPGSGKEERLNMKLVDFLKLQGYSPIYVGGDKLTANPYKHMVERVLPELRFQASNVVALRPGEVISYAGNQQHTIKALRQHNITVHTFRADALPRWHGGPHCLTMPIERI